MSDGFTYKLVHFHDSMTRDPVLVEKFDWCRIDEHRGDIVVATGTKRMLQNAGLILADPPSPLPAETLHWRKVTIESDQRTGEIVIQYSMPNGVPQISRYPRGYFIDKGCEIATAIAIHVVP